MLMIRIKTYVLFAWYEPLCMSLMGGLMWIVVGVEMLMKLSNVDDVVEWMRREVQ